MQRKRKETCAKKKKCHVKRKGTRCNKRKGHHVEKKGHHVEKRRVPYAKKKGKIPCAKNRRNTMWKEIGKVLFANKQVR